jgi:aryl-alcohol dehydrogenase-like predicted oxidoreductase
MWLHYWDATTPLDEILRALDDLVRAGKLLYIGLSDTPAWLCSRAATLAELRGWSRIAAIQVEFSLAARDAERELLPMADALGLGVVCWGALAAGALAGGAEPKRRGRDALPAQIAAAAARLHAISEELAIGPRELALGWLLRRGGMGCIPLIGARTVEQIDQTIAAADQTIDDAAIIQLGAMAKPDLGFPHALIGSSYLRKLALGDSALHEAPRRPRA